MENLRGGLWKKDPTSTFLKLYSISSQGFDPRRENLLFKNGKHFDFHLIQKTLVSSSNIINGLSSRWPGPTFWSPAIGQQGGIAILVNESFQAKIVSSF